jgi:hypothetical protein
MISTKDYTTKRPEYQAVIDRVRDPKPDRDGVMAFCPCHNDGAAHNRRSLHVREKEGKLLLHCFAGCRYEDIIEALGFDRSSRVITTSRQEPETIYDYRDIDGKLLYQVVRFPANADGTKNMKQRRPDGKGGWVWNLQGVKATLYRLPETLAAVQRGETIFICEGERDVDNLTALGLAATTNSGGAGKWQDSFSDYLIGADVVILPDNDGPGRKHAEKVAISVRGCER